MPNGGYDDFHPCHRDGCPCTASYDGKVGHYCCRACRNGTPCEMNSHNRPNNKRKKRSTTSKKKEVWTFGMNSDDDGASIDEPDPSYGGGGGGHKHHHGRHSKAGNYGYGDNTICFYGHGMAYPEFSNFARGFPITLDGKEYPTTEHYFQAQKFVRHDETMELVRRQKSAKEAKALGRQSGHMRSDWEKVKEEVMLKALRAKFTKYVILRELLLITGNKDLVEHTRQDTYWADGGGPGRGLNRLGHLLMQVRQELRNAVEPTQGQGEASSSSSPPARKRQKQS